MIGRRSGLASMVAVVVLGACGSDDEGGGLGVDSPCTSDSECASGLTCDKHGAPDGTCQEPHHDTSGPGSSSSAGASGGEGGSGASGGAGGAGSANGGAGGGEPTACELYCGCMQDSCSDVAGYPYADATACLAACAGFSDEELSCWTGQCFQAARTPGAKVHLCEHAWGELGLAECR